MRTGGRAVVLCLVVALAAAGSAQAADVGAAPPPDAKRPDAPLTWDQVGRDALYVFGRPAHLDRRGWAKVAWAVGIGASLYLVREDVRDFIQDHHDQISGQVLDAARKMGNAATPVATSLGFWIAGAARDSGRDKETATLLLENLGYAGAITGTMQYVIATQRPRDGDGISYFSSNGHSASGDVTIAASILAPVIERHLLVEPDDGRGVRFWKCFGQVSLYGTAGLVALQRMYVDAHWLPDVYFGYLNGLAVGKLLVDSRRGGREWRDQRRKARVEVTAGIGGVRIAWQ
jgi:membrane-associated phospholipid phosphatase